jgi:glyoxylase-like metal-dependent hydrolase (beta-lactamase superfamily II)
MRKSEVLNGSSSQGSGFYRFKIGSFDAVSILDGTLPFEMLRPFIAPDNSDAEYEASLRKPGDKPLNLDVNTLFVDTGEYKILIDTGAGSTFGPECGKQMTHLRQAGIDPALIDSVILSHGHQDHVSGILDEAGHLNFPNARFFINRREWYFWTDEHVKISQRVPDEMKEMAVQIAKRQLAAITDRVTFISPGDRIASCIEAIDARGHSPGQLAFHVTSERSSIVYVADTMHTPTISLEHPGWTNGFDNDQDVGRQTRQAFVERFASEGTPIFVPHFAFPGVGRIVRTASGYGWEAVAKQA